MTGDVAVDPRCHVADAAASPSRIDPGNVRTEPDTRSHLRVTAAHSGRRRCPHCRRSALVYAAVSSWARGGARWLAWRAWWSRSRRVLTLRARQGRRCSQTLIEGGCHERRPNRTYDLCAEPRSVVRRRRRASPCEAGGRVVRRRQSDAWIMLSPRFTSTNQSSSLQPFSQLRTTLMRALTVSC